MKKTALPPLLSILLALPALAQSPVSPADAEVILERLPERIRAALIARATEIEYLIEAVFEMAIASFFDTDALQCCSVKT